jgi:hypothetical protein
MVDCSTFEMSLDDPADSPAPSVDHHAAAGSLRARGTQPRLPVDRTCCSTASFAGVKTTCAVALCSELAINPSTANVIWE